jgi:hypothetical protein
VDAQREKVGHGSEDNVTECIHIIVGLVVVYGKSIGQRAEEMFVVYK